MDNAQRQHVQNMCKYVVIASDAINAFNNVATALKAFESGSGGHVQQSMRINDINQIIRNCLGIFESIIEVSVEDTFKAMNSMSHDEIISSSSAHIGYEITQCKRYLDGSPEMQVSDLLRTIHYTLGNMLYTSIELYYSMTVQIGLDDPEYSAALAETSFESCLADIYCNGSGLGYVEFEHIQRMVRDDINKFNVFENPYSHFGVEFMNFHNIDLREDTGTSDDVDALSFDEMDDDMFITE